MDTEQVASVLSVVAPLSVFLAAMVIVTSREVRERIGPVRGRRRAVAVALLVVGGTSLLARVLLG